MSDQTFTMGKEDCAIIIRKDMSSEMIIPKFGDEESVNWEENQNMFITVAISACMGEPDFRAVITKKLDEMMSKSMPATDGGAEGCDPGDGSCAGGCCGCGPAPEGHDGLDKDPTDV